LCFRRKFQRSLSGTEALKDNPKKKSFRYKERDEEQRQSFIERLKTIPFEHQLWVDECGVESQIKRLYGRCPQGQRVYGETSGKKAERTSVIAAYHQKNLQAPFRFQGYTNTQVVEAWIDNCLAPLLHKGNVVIMDNAAFHKAPSIRARIEATGAELLFLPPYSHYSCRLMVYFL
jgi:hypothetical protein